MNTYHSIVQGEDRSLKFRVMDEDGGSFDISTASEIEADLKNESGSILTLKLSLSEIVVDDPPAGRFTIEITGAQTALLPAASKPVNMTVDFTLTGGKHRIVNFAECILISKQLVQAP